MQSTVFSPREMAAPGPTAKDNEPPWMMEDLTSPLIQKYEARVRELETANIRHADAVEALRKQVEALTMVTVSPTASAAARPVRTGAVAGTSHHTLLMLVPVGCGCLVRKTPVCELSWMLPPTN